MPSPKPNRRVGTRKRMVAHAKILTGPLHKSQLEARNAVISKTDIKSIPETDEPERRNPNAK